MTRDDTRTGPATGPGVTTVHAVGMSRTEAEGSTPLSASMSAPASASPASTAGEGGAPARSFGEALRDVSSVGAAHMDGRVRDPVFAEVVTADNDLIGLVAYALHKQTVLDWHGAFAREKGREPTAEEAEAFATGERTPRRLETYRRLALDALQSHRDGSALATGNAAAPSFGGTEPARFYASGRGGDAAPAVSPSASFLAGRGLLFAFLLIGAVIIGYWALRALGGR